MPEVLCITSIVLSLVACCQALPDSAYDTPPSVDGLIVIHADPSLDQEPQHHHGNNTSLNPEHSSLPLKRRAQNKPAAGHHQDGDRSQVIKITVEQAEEYDLVCIPAYILAEHASLISENVLEQESASGQKSISTSETSQVTKTTVVHSTKTSQLSVGASQSSTKQLQTTSSAINKTESSSFTKQQQFSEEISNQSSTKQLQTTSSTINKTESSSFTKQHQFSEEKSNQSSQILPDNFQSGNSASTLPPDIESSTYSTKEEITSAHSTKNRPQTATIGNVNEPLIVPPHEQIVSLNKLENQSNLIGAAGKDSDDSSVLVSGSVIGSASSKDSASSDSSGLETFSNNSSEAITTIDTPISHPGVSGDSSAVTDSTGITSIDDSSSVSSSSVSSGSASSTALSAGKTSSAASSVGAFSSDNTSGSSTSSAASSDGSSSASASGGSAASSAASGSAASSTDSSSAASALEGSSNEIISGSSSSASSAGGSSSASSSGDSSSASSAVGGSSNEIISGSSSSASSAGGSSSAASAVGGSSNEISSGSSSSTSSSGGSSSATSAGDSSSASSAVDSSSASSAVDSSSASSSSGNSRGSSSSAAAGAISSENSAAVNSGDGTSIVTEEHTTVEHDSNIGSLSTVSNESFSTAHTAEDTSDVSSVDASSSSFIDNTAASDVLHGDSLLAPGSVSDSLLPTIDADSQSEIISGLKTTTLEAQDTEIGSTISSQSSQKTNNEFISGFAAGGSKEFSISDHEKLLDPYHPSGDLDYNFSDFNCTCVSYYMCKEEDIVADGANIIQIRFKNGLDKPLTNSKCRNFLDVCCAKPLQRPDPIVTSNLIQNDDYEAQCGNRNQDGLSVFLEGFKEGESQFGEFPWMAMILEQVASTSGYVKKYGCGGSLIHRQVVLTAAHCVYRKKPSDLVVRLGEWDTKNEKELFAHEDFSVREMRVNSRFNRQTLFDDTALLLLSRPARLKRHVDTVCLPAPAPPGVEWGHGLDLDRCVATGYGKEQYHGGHFQNIMKQVELGVVAHEQCQRRLRSTALSHHFQLHETFTCAGGEKGVDTCKGDGGSPLVCPSLRASHHGRYTQVGIVAWGIGCGEEGIPGVYGNVARMMPWISANMEQLLQSKTQPQAQVTSAAQRKVQALEQNSESATAPATPFAFDRYQTQSY